MYRHEDIRHASHPYRKAPPPTPLSVAMCIKIDITMITSV